MPDTRDVRSLMGAAEEAAGTGDYASAREYLHQAITLQEASVGPTDPFLANTLNNLGVVYEREGRPAEAEQCYRRAYAVASSAFAADHPFVVMSASNLREFCEARGLPFDATRAATDAPAAHEHGVPQSPVTRTVAPIATAAADRMTAGDHGPEPPRHAAAVTTRGEQTTLPPKPSPATGRLVFAGLIIGAFIAIGVLAFQSRSTTRAPQPTAATQTTRANRSKPAPEARSVAPRGEATRERRARAGDSPTKVAASAPAVAAAELCRTLQTGSDWRCAPAAGTLRPGVVFFYTRLLSQADTTVEHRWYRGDRLHQTVRLPVHANSRAGYRTYSQMTVSPARAGDWRVELRAANGAVLHEERFRVGQ